MVVVVVLLVGVVIKLTVLVVASGGGVGGDHVYNDGACGSCGVDCCCGGYYVSRDGCGVTSCGGGDGFGCCRWCW